MVQALVDGGTFVSNNDNTEPFDGTFCSIEFGVNGTDEVTTQAMKLDMRRA